jgi:hypothetical protein
MADEEQRRLAREQRREANRQKWREMQTTPEGRAESQRRAFAKQKFDPKTYDPKTPALLARMAFEGKISRNVVGDIATRLAQIALYSTDERAAISAAQTIYSYRLGKPRQEYEITTNQTLTTEQRTSMVFEMLGVTSTSEITQPRSQPDNQLEGQRDTGPSPAALPAPVRDGPLALPAVGEVPSSGRDVVQRVEVRPKAPDVEGREAD